MVPHKRASETWLRLVLRANGVVCGLAIFPALMPAAWMAATHQWLQLGTFPPGPVVIYMARCLSGLYAALGGLMLLSGTDVRRYGPVIRYLGAVLSGMGLLVLVVGIGIRLPVWWIVAEGPVVMADGMAILLLQRSAAASANRT
jgi:hypothetical protein